MVLPTTASARIQIPSSPMLLPLRLNENNGGWANEKGRGNEMVLERTRKCKCDCLLTCHCVCVWFVRVCRREGGISQTGPIGMRVSLRDTSTTEERERKSTTEREHRAETEVFLNTNIKPYKFSPTLPPSNLIEKEMAPTIAP